MPAIPTIPHQLDTRMTPNKKPFIAVVRGGYSGESVISLQSADCMMSAIDSSRFDACFVTVATEGWSCAYRDGSQCELDRGHFRVIGPDGSRPIDAALIAIHGSPGEDGPLQGYLDLLRVPYQTGGVLNMAMTFSKFTTTALLRQMGFTVAPSVLVQRDMPDALKRAAASGFPCFVKPDRSGSSLGVSKAKSKEDLEQALATAFIECSSVMVEGAVQGIELTCGVMRRKGRIQALPVCEIRTSREFFDYEAKYHASDTQELVPAPIGPMVTELVQQRSTSIYEALECRGMIRVDHFWTGEELVTIEVNTVPGFTAASIFPKMLEAACIDLADAVNGMIEDMLGAR